MKRTLQLDHLVQSPRSAAEPPPLLIMLHGVGSHERDLFDLAPLLDARFLILSLRAPLTLAPDSYAWFHVSFTPTGSVIDAREAEDSRRLLIQFIRDAVAEYHADARRVYLMGFSQGAIMSYSVMLTEPESLAGIVALSGRILPEVKPLVASPERLKDFPVFTAHGLYDNVLPIRNAREARAFLETLPVGLSYHEYPMAHQISEESFADARAWLSAQLDHHKDTDRK